MLIVWIVCELCCWSVPGLLSSECGAPAHAWGTALTVLEWSRAVWCSVSSLVVQCWVCGELLAVKRAVERNDGALNDRLEVKVALRSKTGCKLVVN